jgi:hypothetical protein
MTATRVIDPSITIPLANGKAVTGRLEHFAGPKSLVVFDDESLAPVLLTVPASEAPEHHAALDADQVLLRNWTDLRGAGDALVDQGIVALTGEEVSIGMFRLQAFVARVL